jgi:hypothetical protein
MLEDTVAALEMIGQVHTARIATREHVTPFGSIRSNSPIRILIVIRMTGLGVQLRSVAAQTSRKHCFPEVTR